jgi:hypothetical protein
MAQHRLIVFSEPVDGHEDEYNKWYDEVHLREVVAIDGFVAAQRFKLSEAQFDPSGKGIPARYLAIYDIESDDVSAVLDSLAGAGDKMTMSDALDASAAKAWSFSAIGERLAEG